MPDVFDALGLAAVRLKRQQASRGAPHRERLIAMLERMAERCLCNPAPLPIDQQSQAERMVRASLAEAGNNQTLFWPILEAKLGVFVRQVAREDFPRHHGH